jgi:hypothetical protein
MTINVPRDAVIIAAGIWKLTPDKKNEFREDIMEFIKCNAYSSPEICRSVQIWNQLQYIMYKYIPKISENWEKIVVQYYTAEIDIEEATSNINIK